MRRFAQETFPSAFRSPFGGGSKSNFTPSPRIEIADGGVAPVPEDLTHGDRIDSIANYAPLNTLTNYEPEATLIEWLAGDVDRAGDYEVQYAQVVQLRVTSGELVRTWLIDAAVAGIAPTATLNVDLTARTVTAWLTAISGVPTPTPVLDTFTSDGADVSGSVTGSGTAGDPWTYVVPSSVDAKPIVIGASLDNGTAPAWSDTDTSITITADQAVPEITGTAPSLAAMTEGTTLDDAVTWGSAAPPDGETMTGGSPVREMSIDGAAWATYVGSTAPTAGQTARVRETWETVEGTGPTTFTGNQVTVAASTDQLRVLSFNEATDELSLESDVDGTGPFGIYPAGTVEGDITKADMAAGTDTGLVDHGTVGIFVAGATLPDVEIPDTNLLPGTTYVFAVMVDVDDSGVYSNLVLVTFTTAGAAPEITSVTATPYGARIEYVGTLSVTATPYGAKVEAS